MRQMLIESRAVVEKDAKQGKTLDRLKQKKVLEPWKKWNGDFINTGVFVEALYNDLSGKKEANFIKHN